MTFLMRGGDSNKEQNKELLKYMLLILTPPPTVMVIECNHQYFATKDENINAEL